MRGRLAPGGHLPGFEQYSQMSPGFTLGVALAMEPFFQGIEVFSNRG
jgi:hypothetical protein